MPSVVFPAPLPDDDDDTAWAARTAAVHWDRGEHSEAIVWLRRAADSAIQAGRSDRAADLIEAAVDLSNLREELEAASQRLSADGGAIGNEVAGDVPPSRPAVAPPPLAFLEGLVSRNESPDQDALSPPSSPSASPPPPPRRTKPPLEAAPEPLAEDRVDAEPPPSKHPGAQPSQDREPQSERSKRAASDSPPPTARTSSIPASSRAAELDEDEGPRRPKLRALIERLHQMNEGGASPTPPEPKPEERPAGTEGPRNESVAEAQSAGQSEESPSAPADASAEAAATVETVAPSEGAVVVAAQAEPSLASIDAEQAADPVPSVSDASAETLAPAEPATTSEYSSEPARDAIREHNGAAVPQADGATPVSTQIVPRGISARRRPTSRRVARSGPRHPRAAAKSAATEPAAEPSATLDALVEDESRAMPSATDEARPVAPEASLVTEDSGGIDLVATGEMDQNPGLDATHVDPGAADQGGSEFLGMAPDLRSEETALEPPVLDLQSEEVPLEPPVLDLQDEEVALESAEGTAIPAVGTEPSNQAQLDQVGSTDGAVPTQGGLVVDFGVLDAGVPWPGAGSSSQVLEACAPIGWLESCCSRLWEIKATNEPLRAPFLPVPELSQALSELEHPMDELDDTALESLTDAASDELGDTAIVPLVQPPTAEPEPLAPDLPLGAEGESPALEQAETPCSPVEPSASTVPERREVSEPQGKPPASVPARSQQTARRQSSVSLFGHLLSGVWEWHDLPEEAHERLAKSSRLVALKGDEECQFAALLVISGWVRVVPAVSGEIASVAHAGEVVFATGSLEHAPAAAVVAGEDGAALAVWDEDALDHALSVTTESAQGGDQIAFV